VPMWLPAVTRCTRPSLVCTGRTCCHPAQRAYHPECVERVLFEELAVALGIGRTPLMPAPEPGLDGRNGERMSFRRIDEGLVRLDLRQRLDAPAGSFLVVLAKRARSLSALEQAVSTA